MAPSPRSVVETLLERIRRRSTAGGFSVVVGVALGVLMAALLIPATQDSAVTTVAADDARTLPGAAGGVDAEDGLGPLAGSDGEPGGSGGDTAARRSGAQASTASAGGSGGATPAAGGGTGSTGGEPGATGGGTAATVRGVTADRIRIGVGIPDVGAFGAASEEFDIGDVQQQMEAVLDRWRREGLVPVHGRDVEFVFREYGIIGSDEQFAACNGFIKDDEVFMVLALRDFEDGANCVTDRFDTPVVTLDALTEQDYAQVHPNLFTLRTSIDRTGRNWMQWAHRAGFLEGKTIGIYSGSDRAEDVALSSAVMAALEELGYPDPVHVVTDNSTYGGPQDSLAVQRFQGAGVDLALLIVGTLSQRNFMQNAESQLYRPTYIDTDHREHTSDAGSSVYPAEQYAGTLAMSHTRVGEIRSGQGLTPKAEACIANYERYSGSQIDRSSPESAEMIQILQGCDEAEIVLLGLQGAGRALDHASFIAGVEAIRGMDAVSHGRVSFDAGKHHGVEQQRTVRWLGECSCWSAVSPFAPLWVR